MSLHEIDPDEELASEVLRPGDDEYDDAARVFAGTGRPALVVRPRSPVEVAEAVAYGVRHELPVSVRSGGHSVLGHGTNVDGLVIDLARLDAVEVLDTDRRLVRVGGGARWGAVAAALDPYDWGLTSGDTTSVGVGGLTLGGGIGWMVRRHGLAVDNLVGARVVTADGRLVTASAHEHPDLFWALRGGGGNFGVVVDFDFVAQPVGGVHVGRAVYRPDDPADLLLRWRYAMRRAPDELSSTLVLMPELPGSPPAATVLLCYAGEPGASVTEADAAIEPLLELGTVLEATVAERRYAEVLEDAHHPPGVRVIGRNILAPTLSADLAQAIARLHRSPVPAAVAVRSLGGAFGRVPAQATAFAHRDAEALVVCGFMVPADLADASVEPMLAPWREVAMHGTGTYLNFQGSATPEDLAAAYPPATYERLAAVKAAYDPGNVFALNHNIEPRRRGSAGASASPSGWGRPGDAR
ncbi:FAD-binding oxidoreductase [Nocardioides sp.]|uniref:FAD-binding oxidoreductase n=1 Tax=Nocardioides sp. TaxID=35761 RepID=UPI0025EDC1F9|nr:FAD-binding oxidoreductase [Nocardioides sp.]